MPLHGLSCTSAQLGSWLRPCSCTNRRSTRNGQVPSNWWGQPLDPQSNVNSPNAGAERYNLGNAVQLSGYNPKSLGGALEKNPEPRVIWNPCAPLILHRQFTWLRYTCFYSGPLPISASTEAPMPIMQTRALGQTQWRSPVRCCGAGAALCRGRLPRWRGRLAGGHCR